jgi:hypothetical protein
MRIMMDVSTFLNTYSVGTKVGMEVGTNLSGKILLLGK